MSSSVWYKDGLRFECTGCGACCTGAGRVWVSIEDLQNLAQVLGISLEDCVDQYAQRQAGRWALKEDQSNGNCIFLDSQSRCMVYSGRPQQCRSFPWWPTVLKSPERWQDTARTCEGIDLSSAPLIPISTIQNHLQIEVSARKKR